MKNDNHLSSVHWLIFRFWVTLENPSPISSNMMTLLACPVLLSAFPGCQSKCSSGRLLVTMSEWLSLQFLLSHVDQIFHHPWQLPSSRRSFLVFKNTSIGIILLPNTWFNISDHSVEYFLFLQGYWRCTAQLLLNHDSKSYSKTNGQTEDGLLRKDQRRLHFNVNLHPFCCTFCYL